MLSTGASPLGQSGASVEIVSHGGKRAVRKAAEPGTDAARLARQVTKHGEARSRLAGLPIAVPHVLDDWDERSSSYVMEYVPGVALGEYFATSGLRETREAIDKVISSVDALIARAEEGGQWGASTNLELLAHKLEQVASTACPVPFGPLVQQTTSSLLGVLDQLHLPHGWNHGDFSYENLLVSPRSGMCWAIDFLDSPLETPLIDVGRVLLDAEHGWWASAGHRSSGEVLSSRQLSRRVRDVAASHGVSDLEISTFKALAALRVLPYTRVPARKAVLASVLKTEGALLHDRVRRTGRLHESPDRSGGRSLDPVRPVQTEVLAAAP